MGAGIKLQVLERDRLFYVTISDLTGQKNIRRAKDVDSCVESLPKPDTPDELTLLQFPESVDRRLSAARQRLHRFFHRQLAIYAAGIVLSVHCKRFSVFLQYQRQEQLCRFGEILRAGPVVEAFGGQINVWFVVVHGATSFLFFGQQKKTSAKTNVFFLPFHV